MNQSTPEKHNASSARCLGLRSGVGCAPERALLPQPPHPRNGIAPRGQSPALGGVGRDRGALGPRRRPHRWAPYRVLVPGAEPGLPGDCCPGDAAGGSRSDGRARASGRRRGARGGLRAGPRRGAGPLECSLEFIARNFNLGHSGAQTAEESVRFRVTPACPTPGAEESGLSGIPPPPRVPGAAKGCFMVSNPRWCYPRVLRLRDQTARRSDWMWTETITKMNSGLHHSKNSRSSCRFF
ncbi:uncharacterized protein [Bos indicus]|uniref:Uncharacterized protein isoform X2 n=1 Tax=Bos indicus TaxID=9915 RepID=A0ABM4QM32_BOSIN